MPLIPEPTSLPDVVLLRTVTHADDRGYFREVGRRSELDALGIPPLVQDNESRSRRGVLRGLHYQLAPSAQGKLVRASHGAVWDVAVDLRRGSASFLRWYGVELDANEGAMLWIPEGFGHGFVALTDDAVVHYRTSAPYDAAAERSIRFDDPDIGIEWPIAATELTVSEKDASAPRVTAAEVFVDG